MLGVHLRADLGAGLGVSLLHEWDGRLPSRGEGGCPEILGGVFGGSLLLFLIHGC